MTRIENMEEIKIIVMKPTACTLCAIGQDWYTSHLTIEFTPDKYYPDYIEIQDWIMKEIDGKEMNIEQVVEQIYGFIKHEYLPKELKVTNHVTGCKSHFDVIVSK